MNKKLMAALPLMALGSVSFAQSSVTLFGTVDQAATYVDGRDKWSGLQSGGNADSRIGFRGTEDLGGGLKAQFWLESGILSDTGSGDSGGGLDFKRRATVGLMSNAGELRLGRDETSAYRSMKRFDVFNNAGIGGSQMWSDGFVPNTALTSPTLGDSKRKDNLVAYYSPNWGGFNFAANYGFGESSNDTWKTRAYAGLTLGYNNGAWNAALSAEQQNGNALPVAGSAFELRQRAYSAGVGYDFGRVQISGAYRQSDVSGPAGNSLDGQSYMLGLAAPVGAAGVVKASYNRYEREVVANNELKADHFSLGYEHNLSKRTAMYGTYSYMKNKSNNGQALGMSMGYVPLDENGKQHGVQVGVRHSF
ncbi:MAG: porin [Comamonas sp.]|nr:porin [Candidatus Comamonas equi]